MRLQRAISLNETGVPLEELLQKLSDQTLNLSCARSCAALKLQVHLKQRPLRILMEALAELVPGEWKSLDDKSGYRLEMDERATVRRERWWKLYLGEREGALAAQRAYVLQKMREKPNYAPPGEPTTEPSDPETEARSAAEHEWFRILPTPLQERIAGQMIDNALYRAGTMYMSNPYAQEGMVVARLRDLPPTAQDMVRQRAARFATDDAIIRFSNWGYFVMPSIASPDGKWQSLGFHLTVGFSPRTAILTLDHQWLPEAVRQMGPSAPETWKQLAAYQESHVWKNDPSATKPNHFPPPRRAEVLRWLADKADLEFVADFYSRPATPLSPADRAKPLPRPLKEELDYRALEQDMSWKMRSDSVYLFRSNRWYGDDYLEVPAPLLRRWLAHQDPAVPGKKLDTAGTQTEQIRRLKEQMDREAEIVRALTPWQIANGLTHYVQEGGSPPFDPSKPAYTWRPFQMVADSILSKYNTISFYASLNSTQRTALFEGRLPFGVLAPAQQQQVMYILPELQALAGSPTGAPILLGVATEKLQAVLVAGSNPSPSLGVPLAAHLVVTSPVAAAGR